MHGLFGDGDLGLALIRDGNGARAFDTLLRYRGAAQAELFRTLRLLKALQVETAQEAAPRRRAPAQVEAAPEQALLEGLPDKPEARSNPGEFAALPPTDEAESLPSLNGAEAAALNPAEPREAPPVSAPHESNRTRHLQESWRDRPCGTQTGRPEPSRSDRDQTALASGGALRRRLG
jgi:hypothetical protein